MSELYNRMGSLELAGKIASCNEAVFIYELPSWQINRDESKSRGFRCKEKLFPSNVISIEYKSEGVDEFKVIKESFEVDFNGLEKTKFESLDNITMFEFLDKVFLKYKILIVDITLMNIRFLGAFLAVLSFYEWDKVYFCYTEPGQYIEKERDEKNKVISFDLKYNMQGFDEIPSLHTLGDNTTDCNWIIFMGFEGSRLLKLNTEAEPNRKYVIPVMCIPSMHIEWRNYVMEVNINILDSVGETGKLKYVSAINPFEVYNFLEEEKHRQKGMRMKISPVGTKLTALGSIMYIVENMDDMILTDNPYQEDENSIDYGNSYLYDLTYFVKKIKNKRFEREDN